VSTMGTKAVEDIRGATAALVERLHKLPDELISLSSATESRDLTSEQKLLLGALGLVLERWPDRKAAESLEVSFTFLEKLRKLEPGKPMILTVECSEKFQAEIIRLTEVVETAAAPDCVFRCYDKYGHLICCSTLSGLEALE